MILECSACHARYLVPAGIFAQGGRQVRCARCKQSWHAEPPSHIDVFTPPPAFAAPPARSSSPASAFAMPLASAGPADAAAASFSALAGSVAANLPVVVKNIKWPRYAYKIACGIVLFLALVAWPVLDRQQISEALPGLSGFYASLGLGIHRSGDGLIFDHVRSELRYDGGAMHLDVDGVIHNTTSETKFIPAIGARALGPDGSVIQRWQVAAPAATVAAGSDVPFHTEVTAGMSRTIDRVHLEFHAGDENDDDAD